jgi:predicted ATPase/class 3 adenylate cyclase
MSPELPTGTVTFLFTDIEGSTLLLQELGDRYPGVQEEHAAIVRGAVEEAGGVVARTEGDSFFAAFHSPVQAVGAAVAAQRSLAAHEWSHGKPLRVRMGLHTGEGIPGGGDYVGIDINRAARIGAAGHGGQVILSDATRGLVEHDLPEGTSLRDLGDHRLKDIAHPEHLHDLVIEGLPADFPRLRTLDARPSNLPVQLTSFVGREEEIADIRELLGKARLLTLTGAGGTGKTRLALQVAAEVLADHADGGFFADLSRVTDPALVPSALARAMRIADTSTRPVIESLKEHLADKDLLLVVDSFEQVVEAGPVIEELLAAAPRLTVVATSRVALAVRGEQEYVVPPLDLPDPERLPDVPTLRRFAAVRLFTERARAVAPRFAVTEENAAAVARITAGLDGLPLAIELAATRTKVLTPDQIAGRLDERLALTSSARTVPERQRTLRATIAWSYDLLGEGERRLFAGLSVFAGGWTLVSAEAVCDPGGIGLDVFEGMSSLVDQSLVRRIEANGDESRFTMLETIREFGRERLGAEGEEDAFLRRHAEHFLDLAREAGPHLEKEPAWLDRCDREHDNLRAALRWAIDQGQAGRAQAAAGALWRFWQLRGHLTEARLWFQEVLAMPSGAEPTAARAAALGGAGGIAWWRGDVSEARASYEEALAIERGLGDPARVAEALYNLAFPVIGEDPETAAELFEESLELFRRTGNESGVARALGMLTFGDALAGNWGPVVVRTEEAVAIWRRLGDAFHLTDDLISLSMAYTHLDRLAEARSTALEALDLVLDAESPPGIAGALMAMAFVANRESRHRDALRLIGAVMALSERIGGGPPEEFIHQTVGNPEADARSQLSEDDADRAWEEGRAMTVDDAVALARREPPQA